MSEPRKSEAVAREILDACVDINDCATPIDQLQAAIASALDAARRAAIEECAYLAATHRRHDCGCGDLHSERCIGRCEGYADAASGMAYYIRALADKEGDGR